MIKQTKWGVFSAFLPVVLSAGCDSSSEAGKVRVILTGEESITEGLDQGSEEENTEDYAVRFDRYLAVVGNVELAKRRDGAAQRIAGSTVVNMLELGEDGLSLGELTDLDPGEWREFGFGTPAADDDTKPGPGVSDDERDKMVADALTYWIEGRVLRDAGEGGPLKFSIEASVPTRFTECEFEGELGLSVVEAGSSSATITLHGDHIFFNAFPAASEGSIRRLAGWLIASDLDQNGEVDSAELKQVDASDVFTQARGYSLSGAPIPVETAFDFVRAQLASQGHFRGEGECAWELER
jgi:hypothetical protein